MNETIQITLDRCFIDTTCAYCDTDISCLFGTKGRVICNNSECSKQYHSDKNKDRYQRTMNDPLLRIFYLARRRTHPSNNRNKEYRSSFYKIRPFIKITFGYNPNDRTIATHHIDRDKHNDDKYNLIALPHIEHDRITGRHKDIFLDTLDYEILMSITRAWYQ